jgi:hypothetical protein
MKATWCSFIAVAATGLMAGTAMAQAGPWSRQINSPARFQVLTQFGGAAVLDLETGLVWERSPSVEKQPWSPRNPDTAHIACDTKPVGNRLGWRVPTIQELGSLLDTTRSRPPLTAGHPFVLNAEQQTGEFWSASTAATDPVSPNSAWFADFASNNFPEGIVLYGAGDKTTLRFVWCVRTGPGTDVQ